MNLEIKTIELVHKNTDYGSITLNASFIGSVEAIITRIGKPKTYSLKEFPYNSFSKVSWLKFSFPDAAIMTSYDNDALTFLHQELDFHRVKFLDEEAHSEIFELPWLGESETVNSGLKITRPEADVIMFEAGFNIACLGEALWLISWTAY